MAEKLLDKVSHKQELILRDKQISVIPEPLKYVTEAFDSLLVLDLQDNNIQEIDGDVCKNLPRLLKLDLRNNKIKTISTHIKALMNLTVLKLDFNQLTTLIPEVGNLKLLEELTVEGNRLHEVPSSIGSNLDQLQTLNLADNSIKSLPESIGLLGKCSLKSLFLHGNNFTSFPSSFVHLSNIEELSLEWFLYAKPPRPKIVRRSTEEGKKVFESLATLFNLLVKHKMNECMLVIFLEYYSENIFEVNHVDNRQRTPLHNAAAKGDNGVLEGLL